MALGTRCVCPPGAAAYLHTCKCACSAGVCSCCDAVPVLQLAVHETLNPGVGCHTVHRARRFPLAKRDIQEHYALNAFWSLLLGA